MAMLRRLIPILAAAAALSCVSVGTVPQGDIFLRNMLEERLPGTEVEEVVPGLAYAKWLAEGPVAVHVAAIDLGRAELYLRPILGSNRVDGGLATREGLVAMAKRTHALAAINGDYTSRNYNVAGLTVIDGKVQFAPNPPQRSSIAISRSYKIRLGKFHPDIDKDVDLYQALSGGPVILSSGAFRWDVQPGGVINGENFGLLAESWIGRQAWSVVAFAKDGRTMFWIVVPDSPAWYSVGMTPEEIGGLLEKLRCQDAIRLESGRASQLVVNGKLVSRPPGEETEGIALGSALGLYRASE